MTPWTRTESARPLMPSASMCFRGWRVCARMEPSEICSVSAEDAPPPISTSRPRPRPRLLGAVDKLTRNAVVGVGSGGGRVVGGDGQAVAGSLGEANATRNDGVEDQLAEVPPHLGRDVGSVQCAAVST